MLNFSSASSLLVDESCSVSEDLITSVNLNVYATYQQQGTSELLAFGSKKRLFDDSIKDQQSKKSKQSPDDNEIFITSSDINVHGTFQPSLPSQLYAIDNVLDMTDDLTSPSYSSLNKTNQDAKETLITSMNIDTRGTYQHLCTDYNIPKISRIFHGIEPMSSLDHGEFNYFEMSRGTDNPDVDVSQDFDKNIFWTTAEDIPGQVMECRTLDHAEDFIDNNLGIVDSMFNYDSDTSFSEDPDADQDSYRCISCNHWFLEFFQLMSHVCVKPSSYSMPSPPKNPSKMAFLTSTRKDLASYLSINLPRICEESSM